MRLKTDELNQWETISIVLAERNLAESFVFTASAKPFPVDMWHDTRGCEQKTTNKNPAHLLHFLFFLKVHLHMFSV